MEVETGLWYRTCTQSSWINMIYKISSSVKPTSQDLITVTKLTTQADLWLTFDWPLSKLAMRRHPLLQWIRGWSVSYWTNQRLQSQWPFIWKQFNMFGWSKNSTTSLEEYLNNKAFSLPIFFCFIFSLCYSETIWGFSYFCLHFSKYWSMLSSQFQLYHVLICNPLYRVILSFPQLEFTFVILRMFSPLCLSAEMYHVLPEL